MAERRTIAISEELHRRLKMRAAYERRTVQEVTAQLLHDALNRVSGPDIHSVARDSDPIGEDRSTWES